MNFDCDLIDLIDIGHSLTKIDLVKIKAYSNEIKIPQVQENFLSISSGTDLMFWANRTDNLTWIFDRFIIIGKMDLVGKYYKPESDQNVQNKAHTPYKFIGYFPNYPITTMMYRNVMYTSTFYSYENTSTGNIHHVQIGYIPSSYFSRA